MTSVTHPVSGLPSKSSWLPTIKEVTDACNAAVEPIVQNEARLKRIKEQFEMREREARGEKPTLEQLRAKYGKDWGLNPSGGGEKAMPVAAPSWDEIARAYSADPSRLAALIKNDNE